MAILKRIQDMVTASVNELLDGIEDPEIMINQLIREMEASILDMRQHAAAAIASKRMTEDRLKRLAEALRNCQKQAAVAVENDDDDLARRFLVKKRELVVMEQELKVEQAESTELVAQLKTELSQLEEKVQEARLKRETILAKKRLAESRQRLVKDMNKSRGGGSFADDPREIIKGFDALERLEGHLDVQMAELAARDELSENGGADANASLEDELAALKQKKTTKRTSTRRKRS